MAEPSVSIRRMLDENTTQITDLRKDIEVGERLNLGLSNEKETESGVVRVWSKESGLGPDGVGLRGFKPHTPHQTFQRRFKFGTSP